MANKTFSMDRKKFDELVKSSEKDGAEVEKIINEYLHNEAPEKISQSITGLLPVSNRNKTHAKYSNPFDRQENYNLAVKVMTNKNFNYLVFPDEGRGTSKVNQPQDFTGRGLEAVMSELLDDMAQKITDNFMK